MNASVSPCVLVVLLATASVVSMAAAPSAVSPQATPMPVAWAPLPEADLAKFKVSDFADDELDVPFMLRHFARVAGSVIEQGEHRGFLDIAVNRDPKDNKPYNARIQEMNVVLSYFYVTDRPWNPYYRHPGVRQRLEAMLDFWCRIQQPETGLFAEYSPTNFSLAPTGFGAKAMSRTLERLSAKDAPPFDKALLDRTYAAQRKAIMALLTGEEPYKWGRDWSNQWSGVIRAALAYMKDRPDEEMRRALIAGVRRAAREFASPTGFLYEQGGPDFGYTGVHVQNIRDALPLLDAIPEVKEVVVKEHRDWARWLSYNLVRQPGTGDFFTNGGVNTRTSHAIQTPSVRPVAEFSEPDRAFSETTDERAARLKARRDALARDWPKVPDLVVPSAYSYNPGNVYLASTGNVEWAPTDAQREAAIAAFPYNKDRAFTTLAHDPSRQFSYLFVRRPAYYAALNSGRIRVAPRQSYGLGLLWNDRAGVLVQSVAATEWMWGTRKAGSDAVIETKTVNATTTVGGKRVVPQAGYLPLPGETTVTTYEIDGVKKTVTFTPTSITVEIVGTGQLTEQIPLVRLRGDTLEVKPTAATLTRGETTLTLSAEGEVTVATGNSDTKPIVRGRDQYSRAMITLTGKDRIKYTLTVK